MSQVEKAGGQSSGDGQGISGLDIVCEKHDQVPLHMIGLHLVSSSNMCCLMTA